MCLIDAIGLRDCGAILPSTGKYVNDLAGISTELVQKISDKEQGGFYELWQNVQRIASERFKIDFLSASDKVANFKGVIYRSGNLRVIRNATWLSAGRQAYKGALVNLPSNRGISINLKSLQFISDSDVAGADVVAIDLIDNSEYFRFAHDVVHGRNVVDLESYSIVPLYENSRVFIGIDCEGFAVRQDYSESTYSYCSECGGVPLVEMFEFDGAFLEKSTLSESYRGNGSGVAVSLEVACGIEHSICDNIELLSEALRYLLGFVLLEEKMNSRNSNVFVYGNKEATERLMFSFASMYEKLLQQAVNRIDFSGYCFDCGDYGSISDGWLMP